MSAGLFGTLGPFSSAEAFARCLARNGVIQQDAVDDSECYDNYDTINRCADAYKEITALFNEPNAVAQTPPDSGTEDHE